MPHYSLLSTCCRVILQVFYGEDVFPKVSSSSSLTFSPHNHPSVMLYTKITPFVELKAGGFWGRAVFFLVSSQHEGLHVLNL